MLRLIMCFVSLWYVSLHVSLSEWLGVIHARYLNKLLVGGLYAQADCVFYCVLVSHSCVSLLVRV